jgi:hypothetical protein
VAHGERVGEKSISKVSAVVIGALWASERGSDHGCIEE